MTHLVIYSADGVENIISPRNSLLGPSPASASIQPGQPAADLGKPSTLVWQILEHKPLAFHLLSQAQDVSELLKSIVPAIIIIEHEGGNDTARQQVKQILQDLRNDRTGHKKRSFAILWSHRATNSASERSYWGSKGINMTTNQMEPLMEVINIIQAHCDVPERKGISTSKLLDCHVCHLKLPESDLFQHIELLHNLERAATECPACHDTVSDIVRHLYSSHGENSGAPIAAKLPLFVVVVIRSAEGKFLLIDEVADQGWWFPGGLVYPEESVFEAATQQTLKGTGISVKLSGVLRVEVTPSHLGHRIRVIFFAEPTDLNERPKCTPNIYSNASCWVSSAEIKSKIPLRGPEPIFWSTYLESNAAIWPLSIIPAENAPL